MEKMMIWDNEECWIMKATGSMEKLLYEHKDLEGVYRVVDRKKQTIRFSDINRIQDIRDINKVLTKEDDRETNMSRYFGIANDVLDEIEPITFPYKRKKYTCYIDAFPAWSVNMDDCIGVLYFRDHDKDDMIQAKKFFRIMPVLSVFSYEEIDMLTYNDEKIKYFRREKRNVDKVAEQCTSES